MIGGELTRMDTKECTGCFEVKPLSEFGKSKSTKDGYTYRCLECKRRYAKHHRTTPEGVYSTLMRRHGLNIKEVIISKDNFIDWYVNEPKICAYCDLPEKLIQHIPPMYNRNVIRLTIDCKDNGNKYESGNLVLACLRCNFTKSNYFTYDEMRKIGQEIIKPKWQSYIRENEQ